MICQTTFVSDEGYAYVAGEHITPYEFERLTATERTYFDYPREKEPFGGLGGDEPSYRND